MRVKGKELFHTNIPKVILTDHAINNLHERFFIRDQSHIKPVLERTITEGFLSSDCIDAGERLIEHGCLLIVGDFDCNGTFIISTVFNLSNGAPRGLKCLLKNVAPTPWDSCQVVLSDNGMRASR